MSSHSKLSGMQKQVLGLYRSFLRVARLKTPEERHSIESKISTEFRQNAKNVDRKNFLYIEYLLRRGKKQLEQLKRPDTIGLHTFKLTSSMATSTRSNGRIWEPASEPHGDKPGNNSSASWSWWQDMLPLDKHTRLGTFLLHLGEISTLTNSPIHIWQLIIRIGLIFIKMSL